MLAQIFNTPSKGKIIPVPRGFAKNISSLYPPTSPFMGMLGNLKTSGPTPVYKGFQGRQTVRPQNYGQIFKTPLNISGTTPLPNQYSNVLQVVGSPYAQGVSSATTPAGSGILIVDTPFGQIRITNAYYQQVQNNLAAGGSLAQSQLTALQKQVQKQGLHPTSQFNLLKTQKQRQHQKQMQHAALFGMSTSPIIGPGSTPIGVSGHSRAPSSRSGIFSQRVRGKTFNVSAPSFGIFDDPDEFDYLNADPEYYEDHEMIPPDLDGYEQVDA